MRLYYHKTDGGAEYYCTEHIPDNDEGDIRTAVMRTDGDIIEIFDKKLAEEHIHLALHEDNVYGYTKGKATK